MASIALIVLANSFYDPSNSRETLHEIQSKLNAYKNAPVQTVEAVIGALQHLDMLTNSGQVLCLSLLEQSINASFQSLPDEARGLVYQALLKLALPENPAGGGNSGSPFVPVAVQSVASKVLARVVALSYGVTFEPFMAALMGQLRAPFTGAAAAGDPIALAAAIGKAGQVQQGLRLLYECLVMWLSGDQRGSSGSGSGKQGAGKGLGGGGDPFQASIRLARQAVLANMPSVLELLMAVLALRATVVAGANANASSGLPSVTVFDREITTQILSILDHLAQSLPDPSSLLARDDLLALLAQLAWAVVEPVPADGEVTAALTVAQDTATGALGVLTFIVQRGITTNASAAVTACAAAAQQQPQHQQQLQLQVVSRLRSQLMQLCMALMAAACGGAVPNECLSLFSPSSSPSSAASGFFPSGSAAGGSPAWSAHAASASTAGSGFALPDLATAYSRLSSLDDSCSWALRAFVEAAVGNLLPAIEAAAAANPSLSPSLFSALDLCSVLFTYTLAQSSSEAFIALLRLWGALAERVVALSSSSSGSGSSGDSSRQASYLAAFRGMAAQLLAKVLYSTNSTGLELLSEDTAEDDDDLEDELAGTTAVVGVQFGAGSLGSMAGAANGLSYLTGNSVDEAAGVSDSAFGSGGAGGGGLDDPASSLPIAGGMRGPPSLHRVTAGTSMTLRTRLPSSAYSLRPLHHVSAFAAITALSSSAAGSGSGSSNGVHTPSSGSRAGVAGASGAAGGGEGDEDDEMLLSASLAQGTALAELAGGAGGSSGSGADGDDDDDSGTADHGMAAGGGATGSGVGNDDGGSSSGFRLSERARYIQSSLLLLSKLAGASAEIHGDILAAAGSSLQTSCSALVSTASSPAASPSSSSTSSSPLAQHASDVAVLFALLSDLAHASGNGSNNNAGLATGSDTQRAIVSMATQMLALAVSQNWIVVKTLPLLRVIASSLITVRAFLPTLDAHARLAIYPAAASSPAPSSIPLDAILSFLKDAVTCTLQLLDTSVLPPPPALITDAGVALLVRLSQQPFLRVIARIPSAFPGLHNMFFPPAVVGELASSLQSAPAGTVIATQTGWHKLMASLPALHQAHTLIAGLRFALASLPAAAPSPLASSSVSVSPMASALLAADVTADARSTAAYALLSPFLSAIHDALATPSAASSSSAWASGSASGAAVQAAIVAPAPGVPSSSPSSLSSRLSRAVGLMCAVLSTGGIGGSSSSASASASGGSAAGGGIINEGGGLGAALRSVASPLLAPILTNSCAVVCQLVDAASSPLSSAMTIMAQSASSAAPTAHGGSTGGLLLGGSKASGSSSSMGAPLVNCAELLRLFASSVTALRRSFPDDYLLQALSIVCPQLLRLKELAGDSSSSSTSVASTASSTPAYGSAAMFAGVSGAVAASSGSAGARGALLAGLLPAILYLLRLLRACAAPGANAPAGPVGSPAAAPGSSSSSSVQLRQAIMATVVGPVRAMASPSTAASSGAPGAASPSSPTFRFTEEVAPCSMILTRTVLRNQWRFLLSPSVTVDPATGKRTKTFASQDAANSTYACMALFTAWLANASASPELFRFALLNALAIQKETGNSLWNVPAVQEQTLPEAEVVLMDALLKGERPTLSDDVTKALVAMASSHREDFVSRVIPAWMGKALGPENISSVVGRLDPTVGATLTSPESNADDYGDALLCLISAVRSWQLIKQEAMAVAAGTTVPVY